MKLWKHNRRTGYWEYVREVTPDTGNEWLAVFQKSEPNEKFKVAKNKPK